MSIASELQAYVEKHFTTRDVFLSCAGIEAGFLDELTAAGALPGPIYRIWANGTVWSPIGGQIGTASVLEPVSEWFSVAALWWARRSRLLVQLRCGNAADAASELKASFRADFMDALRADRNARFGYPDLFEGGALVTDRCAAVVEDEWADWINGGYGVCLRRFDAAHLVLRRAKLRVSSCSPTMDPRCS
tara:strand:- start:4320 stop:4889 length:570 start_codon:yes stop_codon:yes gene_type:complete